MSLKRLRACPECDWVVKLPALKKGEAADCPRCQRELAHRHSAPAQKVLAYTLSALVMLIFTLPFPFIAFSMTGVSQEIVLLDAARAMFENEWTSLALLIALTTLVLPGLYLIAILYVYGAILRRAKWPGVRMIARMMSRVRPWLMTDVFLLGVFISIGKLSNMAFVELGWSFYAFFFYVLFLVKSFSVMDADWLWFALYQEPSAPTNTRTGMTAAEQYLKSCQVCGVLHRANETHCQRCHASLAEPSRFRLQATWALLIASAILYIPANLYPMMITQTIGGAIYSTILGGVIQLINTESYVIAVIIFTASFVVPIAKILVLGYLSWLARRPGVRPTQQRMRLYRITEVIGRWSMIDVFVVAITVALMDAGLILSIYPGAAAAAFATVVILTMLAAMAFDPRLLWRVNQETVTRQLEAIPPKVVSE